LWPVVFLVAVGLIVYGTRSDVTNPNVWLLLLPRVVVGWSFLDNAQSDYTWAFNGATSSPPQMRRSNPDLVGISACPESCPPRPAGVARHRDWPRAPHPRARPSQGLSGGNRRLQPQSSETPAHPRRTSNVVSDRIWTSGQRSVAMTPSMRGRRRSIK